jgi:hypothetical protein
MGDDEIKFGVGIDASSFDGGLAKVRQKVDDTSASIQKSFNKANSGARDFKKLIAEVSENVPGLGLALKGVFNPIAAAIAGATLALGYFRNKLADWNADMDRQSEDAATPMGNFAHATEKARVEIAELQRAHKKFAEDMAKSNDDLLDGLKKQIEALESQSRVHKVILAQVKERKTKEIQESGMTPEQKKAAGTRLDQAYAGAQNVTAYRQLQAEQAARLATKDALNKKVSAATFRMQSLDDDPLVSEAAFLRRGDRDNYISKLEAEEKAKRAALAKAQDAASKFSRAPASAADLAGMDSHSDLLAAKDYAERYRAAHGVVDSASAALRTTQAALKAERDKKFTEGEAIKNYRGEIRSGTDGCHERKRSNQRRG